MMKIFKMKSKKGITLVESVFAVVILAILTIGIISLLTAGGVKIFQISGEAGAYSQAVQKMDLIISAISNGSSKYIVNDESTDTCTLKVDELLKALELHEDSNLSLTVSPDLYEGDPASGSHSVSNLRGWYLTVTYQGATVKGFVSNSEGVFDRG